jgi:UDP-N-acetylmuramate--alanine ligase
VGGTHGKTTTTSMIASLLDAGGLDPTVSTAGSSTPTGTNAKVGDGDWIVVEATRATAPFLKLKSTCAVVTNIDPEHLDHYGDFEAVKKAVPRLRGEHPLLRLRRGLHRPSRGPVDGGAGREPPAGGPTGVNPQAEVRAEQHQHGSPTARASTW